MLGHCIHRPFQADSQSTDLGTHHWQATCPRVILEFSWHDSQPATLLLLLLGKGIYRSSTLRITSTVNDDSAAA